MTVLRSTLLLCLLMLLHSGTAQGQWVQTNGPEGGLIRSIASTSRYVFVGNEGGVFRSSDGGSRWVAKTEGMTFLGGASLAIKDSLLFVATFGGGIFRSGDWGDTWTSVNNGLPNLYVTSVIVTDSGLFAGTSRGGVLRSVDDGETWSGTVSALNAELVDGLRSFPGPSGELNLIAKTRQQVNVYRSTDAGSTWMPTDWGSSIAPVSSAASGLVLLASGIRRSTDYGQTWSTIDPSMTGTVVAVSESLVFVLKPTGLFISKDLGSTWDPAVTGLKNTSLWTVHADTSHSQLVLYAGTAGGVFRSDDQGALWQERNSGLVNTNVWSLAARSLPANGTRIFAGTNGGIATTSDYGITWTKVNPGTSDGTFYALLAPETGRDSAYLYAGSTAGIFRSNDDGAIWNPANSGLSSLDVFSLAASDSMVYAGTYGGVYASTDHGDSWQSLSTGLSNVFSLLATTSASGTQILLAGTAAGLYSTIDTGATWNLWENGSPIPVWSLSRIDTFLFAGTDSGVYRKGLSEDGWIPLNNGLTSLYVTPLIAIDGTLYAGTPDGIFASTNLGLTWEDIGIGLRYTNILALAAIPSTTGQYKMFAGTFGGGGIWERSFLYKTVTALNISNEIPGQHRFFQNYPNPFNPVTVIRYAIPSQSRVKLVIYNLLGQVVSELVDGEQFAGWKEVEWNGSSFPSGMYLVRIEALNYVETKKILLVK